MPHFSVKRVVCVCGSGSLSSSDWPFRFFPGLVWLGTSAVLSVGRFWRLARRYGKIPNQTMRFLIKEKVCSSAGPIRIGHFCRLGLGGGASLRAVRAVVIS